MAGKLENLPIVKVSRKIYKVEKERKYFTMYNLILVSAGTIVIRAFEESNEEIIREISGDTLMMRQVLICEDDKVIFEYKRSEGRKPYTLKQVREELAEKKVRRHLTKKEKNVLQCVRYRV